MKPNKAIFWLLDKIFDYLTFEDLERVSLVCKFFCYAATLDRLFLKYELGHVKPTEGYTDQEIEKIIAGALESMVPDDDNETVEREKGRISNQSTIHRTDTKFTHK